MSRKQSETEAADRGSISRFSQDDRAIEGLPIRLVIAIVIGVAALGVMMTMIDGIGGIDDEEITVDFVNNDDSVIEEGDDFDVKVVDENGNGVADAKVVVNEGSARIDEDGSARVFETGSDGTVTIDVTTELPQGQDTGYIEFEVQPPTDSSYTEADDHKQLTVVNDGS